MVPRRTTTSTRSRKNSQSSKKDTREEDAGVLGLSSRRKIRYGVVGLGHISQNAVIPSFKHSQNAILAAFISDTDAKLEKLGAKYNIPAQYKYDQLEACIENEKLDALYIAVPNSLHRNFIQRGVACGAHILCEKPLEVSAVECDQMLCAAETRGVYLMTAYRLHFDEANMEVVRLLRNKAIGDPKIFTSVFSYQVNAENVRLSARLGGGALNDIGIYAINAARYLFRDEPTHVFGHEIRGEDGRFVEVEGTASATMFFSEHRIAQFVCSFAAADSSYFEIIGTEGSLRLEKAYEYSEAPELTVKVGNTSTTRKFKRHDQFAAEIDYFTDCILNNKAPEPSALEGQLDIEIIEAIRRSSELGRRITLNLPTPKKRPNESQVITRPASSNEPYTIGVAPPHSETRKPNRTLKERMR